MRVSLPELKYRNAKSYIKTFIVNCHKLDLKLSMKLI